jgi:23S rRNA (adenine2503-C2)-methyltransferase
MGMGEPFLNTDAVLESLSIITDSRGAGIGTRHVTISTVGIPEGIRRLAGHPGQAGLAISLHSAVQKVREMLVPAARKWSLGEIRKAAERYTVIKKRPVTIEFCLLDGINDTPAEAEALGDFTNGLRCKINLIPFNDIEGSRFRRPPDSRIRTFTALLEEMGREVTVRRSMASRAGGACGQLGASLEGSPG